MAFDGFCTVDGIPGESTDAGHPNSFEILSYAQTTTQSGGAATSRTTGQTGSRAEIGDFTVTKVLDKASPNLSKFCCSGQHIPTVKVELCGASGTKLTYMTYTLTDVVVSSIQTGGTANSEGTRPTEQVSFRYATITWAYTPYDNTGKAGATLTAGWDLSKGTAI